MPHARLAMLLRGELPQSDLAALESRLADPELGPGPCARLLFALAHVLDARCRTMRPLPSTCARMTDFRSIRWANDPAHIATRFRQYRRLMDHWRSVLPVAIHEVDYEAIVNDPERVAQRLVAACGLDWEPACLDFHRTRRPVRTASVTQVRPADLSTCSRPLEALRN